MPTTTDAPRIILEGDPESLSKLINRILYGEDEDPLGVRFADSAIEAVVERQRRPLVYRELPEGIPCQRSRPGGGGCRGDGYIHPYASSIRVLSAQEVLRLTFEKSGEKICLDCYRAG